MKKYIILSLILPLVYLNNQSFQEKRKFKIHTIAFYNVENLFDTINDPFKFDEASPIISVIMLKVG